MGRGMSLTLKSMTARWLRSGSLKLRGKARMRDECLRVTQMEAVVEILRVDEI